MAVVVGEKKERNEKKNIGGYPVSPHAGFMARCVRTPCMLRDVMRCGIIPCWLPMRYLALFTVNAAAGLWRCSSVCACARAGVCVCERGGMLHIFSVSAHDTSVIC